MAKAASKLSGVTVRGGGAAMVVGAVDSIVRSCWMVGDVSLRHLPTGAFFPSSLTHA